MKAILLIAQNTFRESVRDKVLYVIGFFAILMLCASLGFGWVSSGEELQIVQHFSLAVTSFFGALIGVFIGTGLIYKEVDKRTIYTILSKPVRRWQFLLGKFLGLQLVQVCIVLGMGGCSLLFVVWSAYSAPELGELDWKETVNWSLYGWAVFLIYFELMIVTALAMFYSSASSPILSAIFTFCSYLIGQVTYDLHLLVDFQPLQESVSEKTGENLTDFVSTTHGWLLKPIGILCQWILPDLSHFQLRNRVVYGPELDWARPFFEGGIVGAVVYGLTYTAAVLALAILIFDRKRF